MTYRFRSQCWQRAGLIPALALFAYFSVLTAWTDSAWANPSDTAAATAELFDLRPPPAAEEHAQTPLERKEAAQDKYRAARVAFEQHLQRAINPLATGSARRYWDHLANEVLDPSARSQLAWPRRWSEAIVSPLVAKLLPQLRQGPELAQKLIEASKDAGQISHKSADSFAKAVTHIKGRLESLIEEIVNAHTNTDEAVAKTQFPRAEDRRRALALQVGRIEDLVLRLGDAYKGMLLALDHGKLTGIPNKATSQLWSGFSLAPKYDPWTSFRTLPQQEFLDERDVASLLGLPSMEQYRRLRNNDLEAYMGTVGRLKEQRNETLELTRPRTVRERIRGREAIEVLPTNLLQALSPGQQRENKRALFASADERLEEPLFSREALLRVVRGKNLRAERLNSKVRYRYLGASNKQTQSVATQGQIQAAKNALDQALAATQRVLNDRKVVAHRLAQDMFDLRRRTNVDWLELRERAAKPASGERSKSETTAQLSTQAVQLLTPLRSVPKRLRDLVDAAEKAGRSGPRKAAASRKLVTRIEAAQHKLQQSVLGLHIDLDLAAARGQLPQDKSELQALHAEVARLPAVMDSLIAVSKAVRRRTLRGSAGRIDWLFSGHDLLPIERQIAAVERQIGSYRTAPLARLERNAAAAEAQRAVVHNEARQRGLLGRPFTAPAPTSARGQPLFGISYAQAAEALGSALGIGTNLQLVTHLVEQGWLPRYPVKGERGKPGWALDAGQVHALETHLIQAREDWMTAAEAGALWAKALNKKAISSRLVRFLIEQEGVQVERVTGGPRGIRMLRTGDVTRVANELPQIMARQRTAKQAQATKLSEKYLTAKQVADALGGDVRKVEDLVRKGLLTVAARKGGGKTIKPAASRGPRLFETHAVNLLKAQMTEPLPADVWVGEAGVRKLLGVSNKGLEALHADGLTPRLAETGIVYPHAEVLAKAVGAGKLGDRDALRALHGMQPLWSYARARLRQAPARLRRWLPPASASRSTSAKPQRARAAAAGSR